MTVTVVSLLGSSISVETALGECLYWIISITLMDKEAPSVIVGRTILRAGDSGVYKRQKQTDPRLYSKLSPFSFQMWCHPVALTDCTFDVS